MIPIETDSSQFLLLKMNIISRIISKYLIVFIKSTLSLFTYHTITSKVIRLRTRRYLNKKKST